jgi:predicted ATPase
MGMTRAEPPRRPEGTEFSPRGTPALGLKRPDLPEPRFQRTQAATVPQEELRLPKPVFQPNEAEGNPRRPLREAARATLLLSGPEEEPELKTAPGVPHHEETSGEESPSQERLHLDIPTTRQSPLDPAELGLPLDDDADSLATLRPEADFDDEPAPSLRPTTRDRLGAVPPSGDDLLATEIGRQPASLADSFHEETNPKALPQPLYARGQALGELRRVIVVLVAGPARQPVSSVLERAASCLAEAGGLVERRGDGRVTALFGASHSYGDEARRAVRAALCARAPELRVGIGSGRVISSDEGGAVPKAASLLARAEPGEILLSEETFRRVRGLFDVELTHDGVARVLGERLGGVLIGTRSLLGVETPTVGRERELQTLRQALTDSLRGGEARAVLLVGEAGVGKSRLKFESRLLLEELRITPLYLEGAGDPIRAQTPYALLGAALRMLGDIRAGDAPQERLRKLVGLAARLSGQELPRERAEKQASLLATVLGVEILSNAARRTPPQSLRAEIEDLLVGLLSAAARREPVALILEDMQWADAGSLSVLARLVEQPRLKLFLLGIGRSSVLELRPAFFTQAPHQEIRLGALPKEALTALLTTLLGETPPAELLSYLCDATGGNPFLFEELLAALWEKGALAQDANGALVLAKDPASVRVPAEAEALLQSRLDHLPQSEKEALKLGAVFGRLFWEEGLSALGVERARELLDALRSREFIVLRSESRFAGSREYAFRHVLLRDVAYGLLPEVERESLHAKAAAWLESVGERDLVIIARHYELANDEQRAAEHYASAATRAAADYATEAAYAAIERAKALEHRPVLRANLLFLEEDLRFWGGERAKSRELLDELSRIVANLPDAKLRLLLGLREGRLATVSGAFSRGEELLRRVVSDAQQQKDPETELLAITPLARSLNNLGRQDEAIALCRSALAQARILRRPDQLASLLYHIGVGHSQQGELSLSIRYLEESLAASRSAGDQRMEAAAVTSIASTLVNLGCYAEAERYNRDTIALSKRINDAYSAAYGWLNLGNSLTLSARYDEGESALSEAYETAQRFELPWVPDFARGYMARLYAMRNRPGDAQRALALADQALEGSKGRDEQWVAFAHLWRARALLALGDPGRALSAISLALQIRDRLGSMEEGEEDMLLAHFQILSALRRTNEARTAIAVANSFVENRAQRIGDATYRESYLSREVAASAIRAAYLQAKPRI